MQSKIILKDIKIYAYHGVLPEERILGTHYLVNVEVQADLSKAAVSDDLADTINYAQINDVIHREMQIPSQLLEHVMGRILTALSQNFPMITHAKVELTKLQPPMQGEMKGVSVVMAQDF